MKLGRSQGGRLMLLQSHQLAPGGPLSPAGMDGRGSLVTLSFTYCLTVTSLCGN